MNASWKFRPAPWTTTYARVADEAVDVFKRDHSELANSGTEAEVPEQRLLGTYW